MAVVLVTSAIATYARGRGGSPWLWGSVAVGGYVLLVYGLILAAGSGPLSGWRIELLAAGWAWMGLVALYTRYGLGARQLNPGSMWTCTNCKYLNGRHAVICEACQRPYSESAKSRTVGN